MSHSTTASFLANSSPALLVLLSPTSSVQSFSPRDSLTADVLENRCLLVASQKSYYFLNLSLIQWLPEEVGRNFDLTNSFLGRFQWTGTSTEGRALQLRRRCLEGWSGQAAMLHQRSQGEPGPALEVAFLPQSCLLISGPQQVWGYQGGPHGNGQQFSCVAQSSPWKTVDISTSFWLPGLVLGLALTSWHC